MNRSIRTTLLVAGLAFGTSSHAASGNFQIVANGYLGSINPGYCAPGWCGTPASGYGAIASPYFADGRQLILLVESLYANTWPPATRLHMRVAGFTSDPGPGYISSITFNSGCNNPPHSQAFTFDQVWSTYSYNPVDGTATWVFPPRVQCMYPGWYYDFTVQ